MPFCHIFASKINDMKVKLSKSQIDAILNDPQKAKDAKIEAQDPWWVIALKVVAYLIGLILAGVGTAEAATLINVF